MYRKTYRDDISKESLCLKRDSYEKEKDVVEGSMALAAATPAVKSIFAGGVARLVQSLAGAALTNAGAGIGAQLFAGVSLRVGTCAL